MHPASELIREIQDLLNDPHGDSFTRTRVLRAVNRAMREIANRSRSIREGFFHRVVKGQYEYGLPDGFIQVELAKFKYYADQYWDLHPASLQRALNIAHRGYTGYPRRYDVWGKSRIEQVPEVEVAHVVQAAEFEGGVYGDQMVFNALLPISVGNLVYNLSDSDASGTVTYVQSDTENVLTQVGYTPLFNGSRDAAAVGDNIRFTSAYAGNETLIIAPTPQKTDEVGERSIAIYASRRPRHITEQDLDINNDGIELDTEFERALLHLAVYWCRHSESDEDSSTARVSDKNYETAYHKARPIVHRRVLKQQTTWSDSVNEGDHRYFGIDGPLSPSESVWNSTVVRNF